MSAPITTVGTLLEALRSEQKDRRVGVRSSGGEPFYYLELERCQVHHGDSGDPVFEVFGADEDQDRDGSDGSDGSDEVILVLTPSYDTIRSPRRAP